MSEITRIGLRDVSVFKPEQTREKLAELDGDIARARALRDWPQLQEAVIAKINEQAAFVANWDAMVTGNRHNINPSPENAVVGFLSVDEAEGAWLIRQQTVSRWRTSLRDPFAYRDRIMRGSMRAAELIEPQERDYQQPIVPAGRYGTIVVDPPWDMQKIEREVRPNQAGFDYPTMTADELAEPATKWVGRVGEIPLSDLIARCGSP